MYKYKGERDAIQGSWARYFCTCDACIEVQERGDDGRYRDFDAEIAAFFRQHAGCPDELCEE